MAGDSVIFNNLERARSADLNAAQALQTRQLADVLRAIVRTQLSSETVPGESLDRGCVLGGLQASPAGTDVVISAGVLVQTSASTPPSPAPGPDDSPTRVAFQRATAVVPAPAPGSDTFYLLEARMIDTITLQEVVDIFDDSIPAFVPTLEDKRRTRGLEFRFSAGTATAPPLATDASWIPIAVVFRAAGGPPMVATDVRDCRPLLGYSERGGRDLFTDQSVEFRRSWIQTEAIYPGANSLLVGIDVEVLDERGEKLWIKSAGNVDVSIFDRQNALTFPGANNTIRFLYITRTNVYATQNLYAGCANRGTVFVSDDPPTPGNVNTNPVTLANGQVIPARAAVCIGAFRSNGSGWYPFSQVGRRVMCWRDAPTSLSGSLPAVTIVSTRLPPNAKRVEARLGATISSGGAGIIYLTRPGGSGVAGEAFEAINVNSGTPEVSTRVQVPFPKNGSNQICTVHFAIAVAAGNPSFEILGWEF